MRGGGKVRGKKYGEKKYGEKKYVKIKYGDKKSGKPGCTCAHPSGVTSGSHGTCTTIVQTVGKMTSQKEKRGKKWCHFLSFRIRAAPGHVTDVTSGQGRSVPVAPPRSTSNMTWTVPIYYFVPYKACNVLVCGAFWCQRVDSNYINCLNICLTKLIKARHIPHYIIESRNLFNSKMTEQISKEIVDILSKYDTTQVFKLNASSGFLRKHFLRMHCWNRKP